MNFLQGLVKALSHAMSASVSNRNPIFMVFFLITFIKASMHVGA